MKKFTLLVVLLLVATLPMAARKAKKAAPAPAPTAEEIEQRINTILSQMTLDEKVGQLNQLTGTGYSEDMVGQIRAGRVGSILNEVDPATVNRLQREAVENTRLGIPLVFARDVIHGFKTIFPIPLGQAATWNPALVEEGARISADEATAAGVRWTFSPMVDVSRDGRWGRVAESAGEDPYLNGVMGVAMVRGYQGDNLANPRSMAACVKHFCGYGAAESGLDYNTTFIPENHLRDVYLYPFHRCADAGAATFMCSFNDINGIPSSGNTQLLRGILRDEWGWDGLMCSDWSSIQQMIPQGFSADLRQTAIQAANAGVDMDMMSYAYINHLAEAVESGEVPMAVLDDLVRNVLRLKFRLGLFDNPYVDESLIAKSHYAPAHLEAARRSAGESAILLDNKGLLPFSDAVKRVAVVGPMAHNKHDQNGTWCFDLEKEHSVTPYEALVEVYGADNVTFVPGLVSTRDRSTAGFDAATAAARNADVVVYVAGEEAVLSGEAHCRTDITLPGAQSELLAELKATGTPVVLVIMAGRQLAVVDEIKMADATLYAFHGGTMAGPALADVLTGKVNPSGKLPVSLPVMSGQMPLYYSHKSSGRPASDIVLIDDIPMEAGQTSTGCTSFYLDAGYGAAYPFGYGMSYTTFSFGQPRLSATEIAPDGSLTIECDITNTGSREGAEVAQLYVHDKVASVIRPVRELKGFEKVTLAPGETRTVSFTLNGADLAFHNSACQAVVEPGEFEVWVSNDCQSGTPAVFTVK